MASTALNPAVAVEAPARNASSAGVEARESAPRRFQLVRYFSFASLAAFVVVGAAIGLHERGQSTFFAQTQERQSAFFSDVQQSFVKKQEEVALRDLLAIHESGNVNLTRLFANALWDRDFRPFAAKAQEVPVEHCRAIADVEEKGKKVAPKEKKDCFAEVGARIMALPDFKALDAKVFDTMKKSSVFKIKVFDLRGITVYSSEHKQIGEDKAFNAGWKAAAAGQAASELTHRDKFSAFEGVVENRDLISSYIPMYDSRTNAIIGVFEIYSDVTPLLGQIKVTTRDIATSAASNLDKVRAEAEKSQASAATESTQGLFVVMILLLALFVALYLIVRRADRVIRAQADERGEIQARLGESEKMAALGQMVAGVAHQLNTPLAFSKSNVTMVMERLLGLEAPVRVASKLTELVRRTPADPVMLRLGSSRSKVTSIDADPADVHTMREMLNDVLVGIEQMSELVVNMREFTRLDRSAVTEFNLNKALRTVVYMAKSVIPNEIEVVEEYGDIPPILCNPSQLNQVFLNMITNGAQAIAGKGRITVHTHADADFVYVQIRDTGSGIPPDVLPRIFESFFTTKPRGEGTGLGLSIARDIVRNHGGEIAVETEQGAGTRFTIILPRLKIALAA